MGFSFGKDVRMRGFTETLSVEEAWKRFTENVNIKKMEVEEVDILQSLNRVLASDVFSPFNIPPFNRAAMDGYAVKAENTFGASKTNPVILRVVGSVEAGKPSNVVVGDMEAVKVSTGAVMPKNADAVVMVEYTEVLDGEKLVVYSPVYVGANVSKAGEDVKAGEKVLSKGTVLNPHDLGLLAALGFKKVKVFRKPKVAVFSVGDELTDLEENRRLLNGKIFDSNRYFLLSAIKNIGGEALDLGIVGDDVEKVRLKLLEASSKADLTIVCGGTSVGEKDLVPKAVSQTPNSKIVVHGVSIRPGKPVALASVNGKPAVLLPGYPVSAMVGFHLFVRKIFCRMLDSPQLENLCVVKGKIIRSVPSNLGTRDFVRVSLRKVGEEVYVEPVRISGAGVISSMVKADGFVVVAEDREGLKEGEEVEVILF